MPQNLTDEKSKLISLMAANVDPDLLPHVMSSLIGSDHIQQ